MTAPVCCQCGRAEDLSINPATGQVRIETRPYGPDDQPLCHECAQKPEMRPYVEAGIQKYLQAAGDAVVFGDGPPRALRREEVEHVIVIGKITDSGEN